MKYILISMVFVSGLAGFSFGGDCINGFCNKPSGRIQTPQRAIVKPKTKSSQPLNIKCANGKCNKTINTR